MTPNQIELARHALGLPNDGRLSYRNYFTAGPGHPDFHEWMAMVSAGDAITEKRSGLGGDHLFWLTLSGARKAMLPGEEIDDSDFPERLRI
jgi:hypothetical protein